MLPDVGMVQMFSQSAQSFLHLPLFLEKTFFHTLSSNSDEDTTARLLCLACHNHKIASDIHTMWKARFGT